jgi:2-methylisocitrate lyase-like PEP mutase family enzyme
VPYPGAPSGDVDLYIKPNLVPGCFATGLPASHAAVIAAIQRPLATTSGGVAATLGYADGEDAPAGEMLAAAARIARGVEVPVTVDAEAGYKMQPADQLASLRT